MTHFRQARPSDAQRCFAIESEAYEGDEAATLAKIATRIDQYPEGFLILEVEGHVIGFINCGCTYQVNMADDAIKELKGHDPNAPNVVILSVVVDPAHQGQGHAKALMTEFVHHMRLMGKTDIWLMCKSHHVPLYEGFGYRYLRPSTSDHGGMAWHEMAMTL